MNIVVVISPHYDYLTSTVIEGLKELGHNLFSTETSNYVKKTPDWRLKSEINRADLVLIFSNDGVRTSLIPNSLDIPLVYIDGSDSMRLSLPKDFKFNLIFKREYFIKNKYKKMFPLPFGAENRYFFEKNDVEKNIDVVFSANLNGNAFRESINQRLKFQENKNFYIGSTGERSYKRKRFFYDGMPIETPIYRDILSRSKIGVNVIGAGYDCARYWEIIAAKACLLTQKLDILIPNSFEDGVNCMIFETMAEFEEKLNFLINNPEKRQEIANAGYEHLLKYHTTKKRAEYLLKKIKEEYIQGEYFTE